jgi:formate dehydrogenase subunit gamma
MSAQHKPAPAAEHHPKTYQRWNRQHRLQHFFLFMSMFGLMLSGLAIKFHTLAWAKLAFRVMGGFHNNLILHKASATVLIGVSVYHVVFLLIEWKRHRTHPKDWAMMPGPNDVRDAWHHVLYLMQIRKQPPQYDRYTYLEKFEYLSIIWGMVIMGGTGLALWFPTIAAQYVPRVFLDVFRIFHANEAVVATIALVYGHFFTVHLNPGVFPSSSVWYNGQISLEHMLEEHPLEYQRLVAKGELPPMEYHEHKITGWRRWLAGFELIIYSATFYYMLITFLPKVLA